MRDLFTHTGLLVRLVARRERITIPVTVIVFVVINAATAASIAASYGDADKRRMLLAGPGSNAAFRFLLGPVDGADSTAALAVWRAGLFMVTALAVVAALTVVRHTRKEEELGRGELIRSAVTGPLAGPAAATVVTAVLCAVVAVGMAAVLLPLDGGTEPIPLFAVFCQYACTGLAAAGVALLAAQVATTAHIANRLAAVVILSGYLLRGVADTVDGWGWLRWVTPIGWAEMIEPYGANDLLPALACLVLFVVCAGAAGWVALHRDLGAGILTPRPGPAHAGHLGSIGAIAIRLHAPVLASWVVGIGAYALIIGFIQPSVAQLAAGNAQVTEMLRQSGAAATLTDLFVFTMLSLLAVAACGWSVNLAERVRAEEAAGRTEVLLTTPLGRTRFHVAQLGLVVAGSIALPLVAASAMTLGERDRRGRLGPPGRPCVRGRVRADPGGAGDRIRRGAAVRDPAGAHPSRMGAGDRGPVPRAAGRDVRSAAVGEGSVTVRSHAGGADRTDALVAADRLYGDRGGPRRGRLPVLGRPRRGLIVGSGEDAVLGLDGLVLGVETQLGHDGGAGRRIELIDGVLDLRGGGVDDGLLTSEDHRECHESPEAEHDESDLHILRHRRISLRFRSSRRS
nr:hypothetical protein [Gordonia sp. NB41Y]